MYDENSAPRRLSCPDWARPLGSPRLVVIAASAGGLDPIIRVLACLPADFGAAVAVLQHRGTDYPSRLPELLAARTALRVRHARGGEPLEAGAVYVCPPGTHMFAEPCVRLVEGPRVDFVRPSADLMLRSAANAYGGRAIGVVLSGVGRDGAEGCRAIAEAGGTVIVQAAGTCAFPGMPAAAGAAAGVGDDRALSPEEIGLALCRLVDGDRDGAAAARPFASAPAGGGPLSAAGWDGASATASTRVMLADDHLIVLEGLRMLLSGERDMRVVAAAGGGRSAVRLAAELAPDVIVMDVSMPDLDGIEATRQILASRPAAKVVALSSRADAGTLADILGAGASGYLTKETACDELIRAIRAVRAGEIYLSRTVRGIG